MTAAASTVTITAAGTAPTGREFVLAWTSTGGFGITLRDLATGVIDDANPQIQIDDTWRDHLEVQFASSVSTGVGTSATLTMMTDNNPGYRDAPGLVGNQNDQGVLNTYLGVDADGDPIKTPNASRVNFSADQGAGGSAVYDVAIVAGLPAFLGPIDFDLITFAATDNRYGDGFMLGGLVVDGDVSIPAVPEPTTLDAMGANRSEQSERLPRRRP